MGTAVDILSAILATMMLAAAFLVVKAEDKQNIVKIYFGFEVVTMLYALWMRYSVAFTVIIAFILILVSLMMIDDWEDKLEFKLISILIAESLLVITCGYKIALAIIVVVMLVHEVRSQIKKWVSL